MVFKLLLQLFSIREIQYFVKCPLLESLNSHLYYPCPDCTLTSPAPLIFCLRTNSCPPVHYRMSALCEYDSTEHTQGAKHHCPQLLLGKCRRSSFIDIAPFHCSRSLHIMLYNTFAYPHIQYKHIRPHKATLSKIHIENIRF